MTSDSGSESQSWKILSFEFALVQNTAAALMRVTLGGFLGFTGGTGFGQVWSRVCNFCKGCPMTEVSQWRVLLEFSL